MIHLCFPKRIISIRNFESATSAITGNPLKFSFLNDGQHTVDILLFLFFEKTTNKSNSHNNRVLYSSCISESEGLDMVGRHGGVPLLLMADTHEYREHNSLSHSTPW